MDIVYVTMPFNYPDTIHKAWWGAAEHLLRNEEEFLELDFYMEDEPTMFQEINMPTVNQIINECAQLIEVHFLQD